MDKRHGRPSYRCVREGAKQAARVVLACGHAEITAVGSRACYRRAMRQLSMVQPEKGVGWAATLPYSDVRAGGGRDALPWQPQSDDGAPSGIGAVSLRARERMAQCGR
jgi:hypothetical protein